METRGQTKNQKWNTWPTDVYISLTIAETGVVALSHEMMGWGNSNALEGNITCCY